MRIDLLGVSIDAITRDELVDTLVSWVNRAIKRRAYYVNAHALNLAFEDAVFRATLNRADLVYTDGFGVIVGARLTGQHLPEKLTVIDWIDGLLERLGSDAPLFLLGDEPGVAAACAAEMTAKHPELTIVGHHHGFFGMKGPANDAVVGAIRGSGAKVVLVGMGMPRQELWIESNLKDADVRLCLPVGALFRWYAGVNMRPPGWITRNGFEWLVRLLAHPVRYFRRYVVGVPLFLYRIVRLGEHR